MKRFLIGTVLLFAVVANAAAPILKGFTAGSVLFVGSSKQIAQDNANLFWDDTNNRLGLSITTPQSPLHIHGAGPQLVQFTSSNSGSASTDGTYLGHDGGSSFYINNREAAGIHLYTNGSERLQIESDGDIKFVTTMYAVGSSGTTNNRIEAAKLNCDASSSITSQHGSWISTIGNLASGSCTVTLTTGIFSAAPYCVIIDSNTAALNENMAVSVSSATSLSIRSANSNTFALATAFDVTLLCMGAD